MIDNIEDEEVKSFSSEVIDFFKDLIIIVIVVKIVTIFLVSVFIISGESMYSSYYDKEIILVDRFSTLQIGEYKSQKVIRWDVVVFKPGVDEVKEFFIKRVIWMPWDTIRIENWHVFLKKASDPDFVKLDEQYLDEKSYWKTLSQNKVDTYIVPDDKYFVMWDNRNHSSDSRSCFSFSCENTNRDNFIAKEFVVWKVLVDFGYFNWKKFSFTHPDVTVDIKDGDKIIWSEPLSTKPKWMNSIDSYTY